MKPVKNRKSNALTRVRRFFPNVERVRDSRRTVQVRVKDIDTKSGKKKDPAGCALARACVREHIADGAIIGLGYSWLIKKNVATRYKTSVGVAREVVSFDRHQDFAAGVDYKLSKVGPSQRMGQYKGPGGPHKTKRVSYDRVHKTANVRVLK